MSEVGRDDYGMLFLIDVCYNSMMDFFNQQVLTFETETRQANYHKTNNINFIVTIGIVIFAL